ncbi:hypothetical protein [uncultured Olegusella sp.]|uniref:hypothetical protein n=1 Tax=uncultured Olegusella sp. TaxID=1979846 RepID=UPI00262147CA|nr:hypothetical protein [uncultured Olegusella sp.]
MAYKQNDINAAAANSDEKKGLFGEVSFATVFASAMAAGTALILSTKIGVAGSLIGTIIAAAASSFASQIYQQIIHRSAAKLQNVSLPAAFSPYEKNMDSTCSDATAAMSEPAMDQTVVQQRPLTISDKTGPHSHATTGTPIAPHSIRQAVAVRTNKLAWRRLGVAIAAALLALAITAGIISLVTAGQGLGSKTVLMPSTYTKPDSGEQDNSADTQQKAHENANTAATTDNKPTDSTDPSKTDDPAKTDENTHSNENNGENNGNGSSDAANGDPNKTNPSEDKQNPDKSDSGTSSTGTDPSKSGTSDNQTNTSSSSN